MTDKEVVHEGKAPVNWPVRLGKITFFLAAFVLIMFVVLSNLGGNNDTLKSSIEGFAADVTGYWTEIETLNHMGFFPVISLDFENMKLRPSEYEDPVAEIGKAYMAMGFGDVVFRTGKITGFHLERIHVEPRTFLNPSVDLDHLAIFYKPETGQAFLDGKGKIGKENFSAEMAMEAVHSGNKLKYKFITTPPFKLSLGDAQLSGNFNNHGTSLSLENLKFENNGQAATGVLHFTRGEKLTGEIQILDRQKFIEAFGNIETVFYPGAPSWKIPPLDLTIEYEGQKGRLSWDGESCEGDDSVKDLFALPGFECGHEAAL